MRYYIKLVKDNKKVRDGVYETTLELTFPSYEIILREACEQMDIPAPLYLKSQFKHLRSYCSQRYKNDDFVESVDFDYMEMEILKDIKKPRDKEE